MSEGTIRYWLIGCDERAARVEAERVYQQEQTELQAQIEREKANEFAASFIESLFFAPLKSQTHQGPQAPRESPIPR